jgi:hypothetical protein
MRYLIYRWASLGIKLSSLARTYTDHAASISEVLSGKYIEAVVSVTLFLLFYFLTYRAAAFRR